MIKETLHPANKGETLQFHIMLFWAGLICILASGCCLSIIAIRNSVLYGPRHSIGDGLKPVDIKIAGCAGLLFLMAIIFFVAGTFMI